MNMKALYVCLLALLLVSLAGCANSAAVKVKGEMQQGISIENRL